MEEGVDQLTDELKDGHIARLNRGECDPKSSALYTDMVTDLERVSDHAIDILHTLEDSLAGEHDLAVAHK